MTEAAERAFLDAIGRDPDDEGQRLVYADFLEERGELVVATVDRAWWAAVSPTWTVWLVGRVRDGTPCAVAEAEGRSGGQVEIRATVSSADDRSADLAGGDAEARFFEALRADPNDARARRAYAAFLDGQGDPRGELLRVTSELVRLRPSVASVRRLIDRPWLVAVGRLHALVLVALSARFAGVAEVRVERRPRPRHSAAGRSEKG